MITFASKAAYIAPAFGQYNQSAATLAQRIKFGDLDEFDPTDTSEGVGEVEEEGVGEEEATGTTDDENNEQESTVKGTGLTPTIVQSLLPREFQLYTNGVMKLSQKGIEAGAAGKISLGRAGVSFQLLALMEIIKKLHERKIVFEYKKEITDYGEIHKFRPRPLKPLGFWDKGEPWVELTFVADSKKDKLPAKYRVGGKKDGPIIKAYDTQVDESHLDPIIASIGDLYWAAGTSQTLFSKVNLSLAGILNKATENHSIEPNEGAEIFITLLQALGIDDDVIAGYKAVKDAAAALQKHLITQQTATSTNEFTNEAERAKAADNIRTNVVKGAGSLGKTTENLARGLEAVSSAVVNKQTYSVLVNDDGNGVADSIGRLLKVALEVPKLEDYSGKTLQAWLHTVKYAIYIIAGGIWGVNSCTGDQTAGSSGVDSQSFIKIEEPAAKNKVTETAPEPKSTTTAPKKVTAPRSTTKATSNTTIVRKGDGLWAIGKRLGIKGDANLSKFAKANENVPLDIGATRTFKIPK